MGGGDGRRDEAGRMRHGGRWRAEREWPLARTQWTPYYLQADGGLRPHPGPLPEREGTPTERQHPTASTEHPERTLTYAFDPNRPVPTISGNVASYYEHL